LNGYFALFSGVDFLLRFWSKSQVSRSAISLWLMNDQREDVRVKDLEEPIIIYLPPRPTKVGFFPIYKVLPPRIVYLVATWNRL